MRITYFIITLAICFCMSLHAENKANDYMKQAQSSLEQKDFTKARYLYLQAYKAFSNEGDYTQAIDCGTKADVSLLSRKLLSGSIQSFAGK